jgi:hypothetical protein
LIRAFRHFQHPHDTYDDGGIDALNGSATVFVLEEVDL